MARCSLLVSSLEDALHGYPQFHGSSCDVGQPFLGAIGFVTSIGFSKHYVVFGDLPGSQRRHWIDPRSAPGRYILAMSATRTNSSAMLPKIAGSVALVWSSATSANTPSRSIVVKAPSPNRSVHNIVHRSYARHRLIAVGRQYLAPNSVDERQRIDLRPHSQVCVWYRDVGQREHTSPVEHRRRVPPHEH